MSKISEMVEKMEKSEIHYPQLRENHSLRHACGVPPPSKREANNGSLFEGAVGVADWGSA